MSRKPQRQHRQLISQHHPLLTHPEQDCVIEVVEELVQIPP
jgi:hypothetical protein